VKKGPIADWEMDKARNGARSQFIGSLGSSFQRAVLLGQYALFYDNPDLINTRADKIAKVTAADVQRVAAKYLVRTGRTVVLSVPKGSTPSKGDQR
jgi:predicted Zn-dependent peptidase